MKKIALLLAAALLCGILFAGCVKPAPAAAPVAEEPADTPAPLPEGVVETDQEGLGAALGLKFGDVNGAQNVKYYVINDAVGEMHFDFGEVSYVAMITPAAEFTDISGEERTPDSEEKISVKDREGISRRYIEGDKATDIALWFDVVPGIMYCLKATAPDLDGFDITAVAAMVFAPLQGEVG